MADQAPAERDTPQDAPTVDTPERADSQEQVQQEIDWQKRAHDAQAWGTQSSQEAAQLREERAQWQQERDLLHQFYDETNDLQTRREAAEALGIADRFNWGDEENVDPYQQKLTEQERRIAAQEAWREELMQAAQVNAAHAYIDDALPAVAAKLGRDLTHEESVLIGRLAEADPDENGLPSVDAAAELVLGVLKDEQARRPTRRAPHFSATGAEATQVPNLDNRQERQAHMAAQLMANEQ